MTVDGIAPAGRFARSREASGDFPEESLCRITANGQLPQSAERVLESSNLIRFGDGYRFGQGLEMDHRIAVIASVIGDVELMVVPHVGLCSLRDDSHCRVLQATDSDDPVYLGAHQVETAEPPSHSGLGHDELELLGV